MKLNIRKINQEMERMGWNRAELARKMGISRQLLDYYLHKEMRGLKKLDKLARPFHIDPKDLLI